MKVKIVLFISVLLISLQGTAAYGMGIGVSPGNMSFKLAPGTSAEQQIYVINTGNETARYDVFVNESTYQNWFTFSPSSFDLKAGETKEVRVTLKVPASTETDIKCKIYVPCTIPGRSVGAGVIIPVHVEVSTLEESSSERVSSSGSSSKGVSSSGSSSKGIENSSNGSYSKGTENSSNGSYSKGIENSSNPLTKIEINKTLQQSLENIDDRLNFSQNATHIDEELKDYTENLQVIMTKSIDNATRSFEVITKSLGNTIKNLGEKNPSDLTKIKSYEEKFHVLPGFNASLAYVCLVISGLLMRRRLLK
ncbi:MULTISPECIES: COG1470 family protein [Methanosarcina]|uniref:Abnormal spindle-like microcephaly-associated protein ASH domain-containing protein n=2 Tax=Methanosarcina barkeri TaxID=2208 RepID=A0A0E3QTM6_METBA|nr:MULTISPECIES: hypothetical protein [Methanosarcina]AKB54063.1 hypothetical protein MSBRM_1065 [Methanosarcina barkeri MS]AKB57864.1 hypothetical protein MSBR2_1348 [Methanosarcina barkeri 227]OEC90788.1 hypothetical protein A9239_04245 [Methanosarcina sp. A14]